MAITFHPVVEYAKKDGTYHVSIRVTHKRKSVPISTPYYVDACDVMKRPKYKGLQLKTECFIDAVDKIIKSYRKKCNDLGMKTESMSVYEIVDVLKAPEEPDLPEEKESDEPFDLDFISYAREQIKTMKKSTGENYTIAFNALVRFIKAKHIDKITGTQAEIKALEEKEDCKFSVFHIKKKFIDGFIKWIQDQPAPANKKKGKRAESLYPGCIRAMLNRARKEFNDEDEDLILIPNYPFKRISLPKMPKAKRKPLTNEQIQKLINLTYRPRFGQTPKQFNRYNLARDVALISFSLVGINTIDLYKCTDYKNGRISYERSKTRDRRDDNAFISIRVEPEILPLIEKYLDPSGKRVFNFYQHYSDPDIFNSNVNKLLKDVGKDIGIEDLEFYDMRRSWGSCARNRAKIDKYDVHGALNHIDDDMKVTDLYLEKDFSFIDRANRKVFKMFDFSNLVTEEPIKEKKNKSVKKDK